MNKIAKKVILIALFLGYFILPSAGFIPVTGGYSPLSADHNSVAGIPVIMDVGERLLGTNFHHVRVEGKFSLIITEQPMGENTYISDTSNSVTLFRLAQSYGSIGLLAHNYLAGQKFSDVTIGDTVSIHNEENLPLKYFSVQNIVRYKALQPDSILSNFLDLDTGKILTASELSMLMYGQPDQLTLQTCIEHDGNMDWGRLFIVAEPVSIR